MKVFIGANVSANGKILFEEKPEHHVPQEAYSFLQEQAAGNMVLGRNTLEESLKLYPKIFDIIEAVVLSSNKETKEKYKGRFKVVSSPEEAIEYLQSKGHKTIAVVGGTQTYNAFLDKELITDIYFNIVPVITGDGGVLCENIDLNTKFKLVQNKVFMDNIVQVHYTKI